MQPIHVDGPTGVKTTEAGGPRGYDAGKKIKGRKRHALVDTDGRGLVLKAHPASIQDRDGGGPPLCASRGSFPFIEKVFADSGYAGEKVATATVIAVEIVRKSPDQVGFAGQPRRWVVERFFAWINRNRRLAKDFEATIASARAFLYAASVMLLVRRLARAARLSKPTLRRISKPMHARASAMLFRYDSCLVLQRLPINMIRMRKIVDRFVKDPGLVWRGVRLIQMAVNPSEVLPPWIELKHGIDDTLISLGFHQDPIQRFQSNVHN